MVVCKNNFQHIQKFQKQYPDKYKKPKSYVPGENVQFNNKYIKTKWNRKLEAKFHGSFWVLHPLDNQADKIELSKKLTIHNIFHISLLEQKYL